MSRIGSVITLTLMGLLICGPALGTAPPTPSVAVQPDFVDRLAQDTWAYLHAEQTTAHHLPYSWWSPALPGGDYANPAEIGLYALAWVAAYDLGRSWSPPWSETEAEVSAILDQLRAWQTGSQTYQPHGPNAYQHSVFYQWYWISWNPPVVGANSGANHVVPSVDNAWLAAALITIREYAGAHGHTALAQKADVILGDMDFTLWYNPTTHRFTWGAVENPQGGSEADYYSNENRIINFVARALGHLSAEEFHLSLAALEAPSGSYGDITVARMAWDGSYFTYAAPALFIREVSTSYGAETLLPATQAQIAYARDRGYVAWGLSDCFDVGEGGYVQQGAPPAASPDPPETRPGLVTPHAAGLALITPLASEAIINLQTLSTTFPCAYSRFGLPRLSDDPSRRRRLWAVQRAPQRAGAGVAVPGTGQPRQRLCLALLLSGCRRPGGAPGNVRRREGVPAAGHPKVSLETDAPVGE